MAYIRAHDTAVRRGGKPVKRYEVIWREPLIDPETYLPIPGRIRSRQESFTTREAAEARRDELNLARHFSGTHSLAEARKLGAKPFGEWAAAWLTSLQLRVDQGSLKQRTHDDAARLLRRYILENFGGRAIGSINALDAEQFLADLVGKPSTQGNHCPLSRGTVAHAWNTFRGVMRYAQTHKAITENPCDGVDVVATRAARGHGNFEHKPLTAVQVAALADAISGSGDPGLPAYPIYGLMVTFLAYTGLRASENAGLEIRDIVLRYDGSGPVAGLVQVRRTKDRKGGEWHTGTPKSRRSRRSVPLPPWLAQQLMNYLAEHPRSQDPTAPLWPSRKNGGGYRAQGQRYPVPYDWSQPIAMGTFYETIMKPAVEAIGLPASRPASATSGGVPTPAIKGVRLHDLRHTFAVMQLMAGTHHMQVSKWLGHATRALVLDVYGDWIPEDDVIGNDLPAPPASRSQTVTNVVSLNSSPRRHASGRDWTPQRRQVN